MRQELVNYLAISEPLVSWAINDIFDNFFTIRFLKQQQKLYLQQSETKSQDEKMALLTYNISLLSMPD